MKLEDWGKTPEDREELTRAVREGRRVSRHSISRGVRFESGWQVLGADFRTRLTSLIHRLKSAKRDAVKWTCQRWRTSACRLRIKLASDFDDFVTKKTENSSGRSGCGNKVGRGVNASHENELLPQDTTHLIQRPCYQRGSPCQDPAGNRTT